jgi:hypothetical protein
VFQLFPGCRLSGRSFFLVFNNFAHNYFYKTGQALSLLKMFKLKSMVIVPSRIDPYNIFFKE